MFKLVGLKNTVSGVKKRAAFQNMKSKTDTKIGQNKIAFSLICAHNVSEI